MFLILINNAWLEQKIILKKKFNLLSEKIKFKTIVVY